MNPDLLERLTRIVGDKNVLVGDDLARRMSGFWTDERTEARALVRPASTDEVARVLRCCHAARQPVVTQGGQTGLCGGHLADANAVILSTERLQNIESVDTANRSVVCETGVVLERLQQSAEASGLKFAVDFGARGSATVGGMVATNAGGSAVLRYGMMREQVLGLEAVLANGEVVSNLRPLIKNNTGYDLKQWFIGSEGTLGIVTRAALRLVPDTAYRQTAFAAARDFASVTALLTQLESEQAGRMSAFEVLWNSFYRLNTGPHGSVSPPLEDTWSYYVLVECEYPSEPSEYGADSLSASLERALEQELIVDAIVAQSETERQRLWHVREDMEPEKRAFGRYLFDYDVSLAVRDMEQFTADLSEALSRHIDGCHLFVFGHVADGNLHLAAGRPDLDGRASVDAIVFDLVESFGGSISAEHGIGRFKRDYLHYSRSASEIELMRTIKRALDPDNILNPGKTVPL